MLIIRLRFLFFFMCVSFNTLVRVWMKYEKVV